MFAIYNSRNETGSKAAPLFFRKAIGEGIVILGMELLRSVEHSGTLGHELPRSPLHTNPGRKGTEIQHSEKWYFAQLVDYGPS